MKNLYRGDAGDNEDEKENGLWEGERLDGVLAMGTFNRGLKSLAERVISLHPFPIGSVRIYQIK